MKPQPRLRYYTRFRESVGRLRIVIWYKGVRKFLSTPIIIDRDQLAKLDSIGKINCTTIEDCELDSRIDHYTKSVWRVVTPLIEQGKFAETPSQTISNMVDRAGGFRGTCFDYLAEEEPEMFPGGKTTDLQLRKVQKWESLTIKTINANRKRGKEDGK